MRHVQCATYPGKKQVIDEDEQIMHGRRFVYSHIKILVDIITLKYSSWSAPKKRPDLVFKNNPDVALVGGTHTWYEIAPKTI